MAEIRRFPRWVSAAEVALFYALAHGIIWAGGRFRPTILVIALIMIALCIASNVLHKDTLERIGLASEHFWPCLRLVVFAGLPIVVPLIVIGLSKRAHWPWDLAFAVAGYPVWGFAQEYALLGFVNNRLEDVMIGRESLTPWINGLLFSMAHLPNPVLMVVTFAAGVVFTMVFRRHRHLVPIALMHAAVGVGISLAFADINGIMSVGPGYGTRLGELPLKF